MSKGFPTGDGCFKMGYIKRPLKEPGNFTEEDYTQMSKGLTTIGLKCSDNTPEKMVEYVDDIRKSLPNPLPSELHAFMAAREGKQTGFEFVVDPTNVNVSKMDVVIGHIEELMETGAYFVGHKSTSSHFQSSTVGTIMEAFKAVGKVISDVEGGKVDPGQIMNTIGGVISSLTETTSKDFDQTVSKTLFCIAKPDHDKKTAAAICGLKYTYTMHVEDYKSKKESTHKASYSMQQWNVVFTDPKIFESVYEKLAGGK